MEEKKLSMDEALAILDRHAAEADVGYKGVGGEVKPKRVVKVKDALKEGVKAKKRGILGTGTRRQLDELEKQGH